MSAGGDELYVNLTRNQVNRCSVKMASKLLRSVCLLVCTAELAFAKDIILKPVGSSGPTIGIVFIQGAEIPSSAYVPLTQQVQTDLLAWNVTAWVGIPEFLGDVAEPLVVAAGVNRILKALDGAGLPAAAPLFIMGHSLGGVSLQLYVSGNPNKFVAQILLGAYILRTQLSNGTVATPTLTVGAELDGLSRVTRIAESYFHQIVAPKGYFEHNASLDYPVTVILGMSHMQFASGTPPSLVKAKDLQPEITYNDAHTFASIDISAFIAAHVSSIQQNTAGAHIIQRVQESGVFFDPIIRAFALEGSAHLYPPCNDSPASPACTVGCPWTEQAQVFMGNVSRPLLSLNVSDAFHPMSALSPSHVPHVLTNCTDAGQQCVLQVTTVSQAVYDPLDATDTGLAPVSASEIRTMLKSRQAIYAAAGQPADFNQTDAASLCAQINAQALLWALNTSSARSRQRYNHIGEPYVFGNDVGPYSESSWVHSSLSYQSIKNNVTGDTEVQVQAPMLKTPLMYKTPSAAGMHYCKLLSPSRALEWIYVDSIRLHGSINATHL